MILAVGATPGIPARVGTTPPVGSSPRPAQPAQAPSRFNPLIPYASFGWLPAGQTLTAGGTGRTEMYVNAGPKRGKTVWSLTFYSAGRCQLSTAQKGMDCTYSASGGQTASITGRAPAVRGHRAFWAGGYLIWQYARGGWALLSFPSPPRCAESRRACPVWGGRRAAHRVPGPAHGRAAHLAGQQRCIPPGRRGAASQPVFPDRGGCRARCWQRRVPPQHSRPRYGPRHLAQLLPLLPERPVHPRG